MALLCCAYRIVFQHIWLYVVYECSRVKGLCSFVPQLFSLLLPTTTPDVAEGGLMNDFTGRVRREDWHSPNGFRRTVTVAMDTAQYQMDINHMQAAKGEDLYGTFNLVMRRKPKACFHWLHHAWLLPIVCSVLTSLCLPQVLILLTHMHLLPDGLSTKLSKC